MSVKQTIYVAMPITIRLVLGGVFLWAGLSKVFKPLIFAQTIKAYGILPDIAIFPFAAVLPWIEVVVGVLLILGIWMQSNALVCITLLFSFQIALGINIYKGADFSCGCFGFRESGDPLVFTMIQDFFLLIGATILLFVRSIPLSFNRFRTHFAGILRKTV